MATLTHIWASPSLLVAYHHTVHNAEENSTETEGSSRAVESAKLHGSQSDNSQTEGIEWNHSIFPIWDAVTCGVSPVN